MAKLEGLSVYWNSSTTMISQESDNKPLMLSKLLQFVHEDAALTHGEDTTQIFLFFSRRFSVAILVHVNRFLF